MNSPTAALFINERKLRIRLNYPFRTENENISVLVVFDWGRGTVSEMKAHKYLSKFNFWNGLKSARLRRDAQYRNYQAQLNQYDQFGALPYTAEVRPGLELGNHLYSREILDFPILTMRPILTTIYLMTIVIFLITMMIL